MQQTNFQLSSHYSIDRSTTHFSNDISQCDEIRQNFVFLQQIQKRSTNHSLRLACSAVSHHHGITISNQIPTIFPRYTHRRQDTSSSTLQQTPEPAAHLLHVCIMLATHNMHLIVLHTCCSPYCGTQPIACALSVMYRHGGGNKIFTRKTEYRASMIHCTRLRCPRLYSTKGLQEQRYLPHDVGE